MDILEIEEEHRMRREEAAKLLHQVADSLERHNSVEFKREGLKYTVKVPDQVDVTVEIEVTDTGGELEIELHW